MGVGDWRKRVEDDSTQLKFMVKIVAHAAGQVVYFTPDHWASVLNRLSCSGLSTSMLTRRRLPALEAPHMLACIEVVSDVSLYVRRPSLYVRAVLLAARDFEQLKHQRISQAIARPSLIPEAFDALRPFGRDVQLGEDASVQGRGAGG